MRERMVVCGGLQAPRGSPTDTLKLDVNASAGSPHKVNLHLGDLCAIVSGRQAIFGDDRFLCYYPRQTQLTANRRQRPAHHDVSV